MKKKMTETCAYPNFCGMASVGERGQIVIPKEARDALKIKTGDNMVAMIHNGALVFFPKDKMKSFITKLASHLKM